MGEKTSPEVKSNEIFKFYFGEEMFCLRNLGKNDGSVFETECFSMIIHCVSAQSHYM